MDYWKITCMMKDGVIQFHCIQYMGLKKLLKLGVKVVFITGRGEDQRNVKTTNLKNVGYHTWEKLVLNCGLDHLIRTISPLVKLKRHFYCAVYILVTFSTYSGNTSYVYKSAERTKACEEWI
ncbi:unnamed protein product [Prunus armeniaca]|uniref:Acid phosphatase n=1 Tax=Prunus armeniaca TaxID=36596 RepID=A0A6J5WMT0_PRUAR|nr:unnamed protein product [Prunus armeniaca]